MQLFRQPGEARSVNSRFRFLVALRPPRTLLAANPRPIPAAWSRSLAGTPLLLLQINDFISTPSLCSVISGMAAAADEHRRFTPANSAASGIPDTLANTEPERTELYQSFRRDSCGRKMRFDDSV